MAAGRAGRQRGTGPGGASSAGGTDKQRRGGPDKQRRGGPVCPAMERGRWALRDPICEPTPEPPQRPPSRDGEGTLDTRRARCGTHRGAIPRTRDGEGTSGTWDPFGAPVPVPPTGRSSRGMGWGGSRATPGARWPPGKWPEARSHSVPPLSPQKVTVQPIGAKDIPQNAGLAKRPKGKEGGMREGGFPNPDVTERRQRTEPGMGAGSGDAAPTRFPHGAERGSGAGRVGGRGGGTASGAAAWRAEPEGLGSGSELTETRNRNPRPAERRTGGDPESRGEP